MTTPALIVLASLVPFLDLQFPISDHLLSLPPSWLPVVRFIEEQFEQYLRDESGLNRKNIQDSRVHCCLYFISPFGRG